MNPFHGGRLAALAILFSNLPACAAATSLRGGTEDDALVRHDHRVLQADVTGTYLIAAIQKDGTMVETDNVELDDGQIYQLINSGPPGWARANGYKSGISQVTIPAGSTFSGAGLNTHGASPPQRVVPNSPGNSAEATGRRGLLRDEEHEDESLTPEQQRNRHELRRQLAVVEGTRKVLAVRVNHNGPGSLGAPASSATAISDEIFGTGGDQVNMRTQYLACSHGKLNMQPAADATAGGLSITDGVVEVTVGTDCTTLPCDGVMRNDVNNALSAAFGSTILGGDLAHHVMHCLPANAMGGIAYAYINHWNSVYSNK